MADHKNTEEEAMSTGKTTKRLATLVGCNYAGTRNELRGCINDVRAMRESLVGRFGFEPADVAVLTDDGNGDGGPSPTGANIKRALADMVASAAPGDVLFFHYSGHGTLVPPRHGGGGEEEEEEEAIVPCDFNLITGVDFRRLVDKVPAGASFTMVSDSCHSGGLIDQEKEQIGPYSVEVSGTPPPTAAPSRKARFLPYGALLDHLAGASGVAHSHHAADHLLVLFGADASAKFHHGGGAAAPTPAQRPDGGILLSGCQKDETSADLAAEDDGDDEACGAFSSAVQRVLAGGGAPGAGEQPGGGGEGQGVATAAGVRAAPLPLLQRRQRRRAVPLAGAGRDGGGAVIRAGATTHEARAHACVSSGAVLCMFPRTWIKMCVSVYVHVSCIVIIRKLSSSSSSTISGYPPLVVDVKHISALA